MRFSPKFITRSRSGLGTLVGGPAVIGAFRPAVYLLIRMATAASHVVDEDGARAGLDGEPEGVTKAQSPDGPVVAGGLFVEGIVGGNGAVLVYAQHLAEEVGKLLRVVRGISTV